MKAAVAAHHIQQKRNMLPWNLREVHIQEQLHMLQVEVVNSQGGMRWQDMLQVHHMEMQAHCYIGMLMTDCRV